MRLLFCVLMLSGFCVANAETETAPKASEQLTAVSIGPLSVDAEKRQIRMRAQLAITEGILEYLLVEAKGKTYESVFSWEGAKGSELNFALLLLGSEPWDFQKFTAWRDGESVSANAEPLPAPPLSAKWRASLEKNGQPVPWSTLLKSREGDLPPTLDFVHTGSFFTEDNRFAADINLSHIALWRDGSAILNLLDKSGNPYRGNLGFEVNKESRLAKGDVFTLVLEPLFTAPAPETPATK